MEKESPKTIAKTSRDRITKYVGMAGFVFANRLSVLRLWNQTFNDAYWIINQTRLL